MQQFLKITCIFTLFISFSLDKAAAQNSWLNFEQKGNAAFFSENRELTTAGEPVREDLLEVAHARIPYGTVLEIHNLSNNKKVKARVNDRIFKKNYIIGLNKATAAELDIPAETLTEIQIKVIQINVNREGIQAEKELYLENLKKKVENEIEVMADSILAAEAEEEKKAAEKENSKEEAEEKVKQKNVKKIEINPLFKKAEKTPGFYDEKAKQLKISGFAVQIGNFGTLEAAFERTAECLEKSKLKTNFIFQSYKIQGKMRFKVFCEIKKTKKDCLPLLKKITSAGFQDAFVKKLP